MIDFLLRIFKQRVGVFVKIGIPKEIKNNENRVAMTPAGVVTLTNAGHEVYIQKGAGLGSSFTDEDYIAAGAKIVDTAEEAWSQELILKVKEPIESEYKYFYEGQILFTYLHLAPEYELTQALLDKKVIGIAYETVQLPNRALPLLTPMSEVAGKMSVQIGAHHLEKLNGGNGILLGGVPGVPRGKVTIIGGGVAGTNAARVAIGMGADVTIIELNPDRLRQLEDIFGSSVKTLISNPYNIAESVKQSDLVISSVLIPGARAPKLVTEEMVKQMKPGSVIVDIAIDQGGSTEITANNPTSHDKPTFEKYGVLHYAVPNIPGAVPRTSTIALTNVTVPYALQIANKGYKQACLENETLKKGLNTLNGYVVYKAVADEQQREYVSADTLLQD